MNTLEIINALKEAFSFLERADDDLDIVCTENNSSNPKEIKALGELVAHLITGKNKIKRLLKKLQNDND